MKIRTKAMLWSHIIRWLITRGMWNTNYAYLVPGNPKFMGPRDAVKNIPDGAVMAFSGLGGNQWVSIIYRTMRKLYEETGHPKDITAIVIGGNGSRGRAPGSIEEIGLEGLCTRFFTGHMETFKSLLKLGAAGKMELQVLPQGVMAFLIEAQGRGEKSILTDTGVGTFMDPRIGMGSPLVGTEQWVTPEGDKLRYRLPDINVAAFNAPAADKKGNIYIKNCGMIAESMEIARAARKNGGFVIANVAQVVEEGYDEIFMTADEVDAVVVYPRTQQVAAVEHRHFWPVFTLNSDMPLEEGVEMLKYVNQTLGITPRRSAVDDAVARLAATVFSEQLSKDSFVNIGIGLPEEVCRLVCETGLSKDIQFFSESGVLGGLPAPGVWFGAGVCPEKMITSAQVFHKCYEHLDASILGMLEFDATGNVNVSKRGEGPLNYVGPGGFIDFSSTARNVFFVCSWMVHGGMAIEDGKLRFVKRNPIKLVDKIAEITFSGKHALERNQNIFYITNVGAFKLTPDGLELIRVVPGVDIRKDILEPSNNKIKVSDSGDMPVADRSIMTGENFKLSLKSK